MNADQHRADGPLVSVIIPVYNGARVIGRCLDSLAEQDYPRVEVIVADDGSTDGTPERIPPGVRLVRTGGRRGAGAARNAGAREAAGDLLMFTDADCVLPPSWVSRAVRIVREKKVLCGGGGYAGPVQNNFIQTFAYEELAYRRRRFKGYVKTLVSNNIFCDRQLFREKGGFPENVVAASSEDLEFSWAVSSTHALWWDADNGVYHDFPNSLRAYLSQQYRFARDTVPMLFRHAELIGGRTHVGKQLYVELVLAAAAAACLALGQWVGALAALILIGAVNAGFILHMLRRQSIIFTIRALGVVVMRDFDMVWGGIMGAIKVLAMLFNRRPPAPPKGLS